MAKSSTAMAGSSAPAGPATEAPPARGIFRARGILRGFGTRSARGPKKAISPGFTEAYASEADGTRTRNHRIDSPPASRHNPLAGNEFAPNESSGRTPGRTHGETAPLPAVADADLAALIAAWPTMPDHIRAAIRALVAAASVAV